MADDPYEDLEVRQLAFVINGSKFPLAKAPDFYSKWADRTHWKLIQPELEGFRDTWDHFRLEDGTKVRQLVRHWQSPDGQWSLRVAVRFSSQSSAEQVFVSLSPFFLLSDEE